MRWPKIKILNKSCSYKPLNYRITALNISTTIKPSTKLWEKNIFDTISLRLCKYVPLHSRAQMFHPLSSQLRCKKKQSQYTPRLLWPSNCHTGFSRTHLWSVVPAYNIWRPVRYYSRYTHAFRRSPCPVPTL